MIKFSLICECESKFEGWFPSNEEYENQLALGQLVCPMCDSTKVRKDIMSPNVKKSKKKTVKVRNPTPRERGREEVQSIAGDKMVMGGRARTLLKQIQKHVEKNFENVGKKFAKEARKAHAGERDQEFYGKPSKKEVKDLVNEGIDLFAVPEVKDN